MFYATQNKCNIAKVKNQFHFIFFHWAAQYSPSPDEQAKFIL